MLITWRYQPKVSLIHSFDPRAWILFNLLYFTSVMLFWDIRCLSVLFGLTIVCITLSRVHLFESWRSWLDIGGFFLFFTLFAFITGRGGLQTFSNEHVLYLIRFPWTVYHWSPSITISAEKIMYAMGLLVRILNLSLMTLLMICCINPNYYGVIFRRMGLPDSIAFGMDLTLRFIPSFGKDFLQTMDAQKARGLEVESRRIGFISRIRRVIPIIVPVTIRAIADSEDISNAMDLRAFGSGPRSWLVQLHFRWRDYILLGFGLIMLLGCIYLVTAGYGILWIPPFLLSTGS